MHAQKFNMAQDYRNKIEDIKKITEKGIKRPVPASKKDLHFGDFSKLINLLTLLQVNTDLFTNVLQLDDFYDRSSQILKEITPKLLKLVEPNKHITGVYDYLSEQDNLEKSDCIFVFGGKSLSRPQKAAELYLDSYAPLIYCSGSRPIEEMTREHEGRKFKEYILSNYKINNSAIVADPNENSLSMVENVRGFLNWYDENGKKLQSVIIVIQEHNLRRAWAIFNKFAENVKINRSSCGNLENLTRETWFKNEIGIKLIYEEYEKIKIQQILNCS